MMMLMLLLYDAVNAAFAALTYFGTSDEIIPKLKVQRPCLGQGHEVIVQPHCYSDSSPTIAIV